MSASGPLDILLVEDSQADARLIEEALQSSGCRFRLNVICDGEAALKLLDGLHSRRLGVKAPDLILLDLNLPKRNGHEVLQELKADQHLRQIPVVVLSSSSDPVDIDKAYDSHANAYVAKPTEMDAFFRAVADIVEFWSRSAKLPSGMAPTR